MATVQKSITLVNPGRRRRARNAGKKKRLSLAQKLHFGTKRQRAAAQASLKGHRKRKRNSGYFIPGGGVPKGPKGYSPRGNRKERKALKSGKITKATYYAKKRLTRTKKYDPSRLGNVGEIITIRPLTNSGTKRKRNNTKSMARRKRRTRRSNPASVTRRRTYRRRRVAASTTHRRRSVRRRRNPAVKTIVRYKNRGSMRRRVGRRRNAGISSGGGFTTAAGVIGGAMVTKFVTDMLPGGLGTGIPGYIASALVATLQGKMIGKLLKSPKLGSDMAIGGYVYTALKVANDLMPGLGLPFKLSGVYGTSSFYVPQANVYGNMGRFVPPAAMMAAIPAPAMRGLGQMGSPGVSQRRMGRTS